MSRPDPWTVPEAGVRVNGRDFALGCQFMHRHSWPDCFDDGAALARSDLDRVCDCGHPIDEHQTGTGPWTGFCADPDCKCERPEVTR